MCRSLFGPHVWALETRKFSQPAAFLQVRTQDRGVLNLNYPKMQSHSVIHGSQHQTYIMPDTGNIIDWLINMRKNKSEILIYKFTLLILKKGMAYTYTVRLQSFNTRFIRNRSLYKTTLLLRRLQHAFHLTLYAYWHGRKASECLCRIQLPECS